MQQRGFVPDSVWLSRTLRAANRDEITRLGLAPGATVARLERLRRADGIVMAVEHSTLPVAVVPDPQVLGASLYEYLEARGMTVVRALQHFRGERDARDREMDGGEAGIGPCW